MRRGRIGVMVGLVCASAILSQKPAFSENLQKISHSPASRPSQLVSLVYHAVATTNGSLGYISEEYQRLVRPNLYVTGELLFGQGKMNAGAEGEIQRKSEDSIVALGIGFRRYIGLSHLVDLWCGGSVSVARVATTFQVSGEPESTTEVSGLLTGRMGCRRFFGQSLAMEIVVGLAWPSLYPKPGMPDDLYASPFFGLGLALAL